MNQKFYKKVSKCRTSHTSISDKKMEPPLPYCAGMRGGGGEDCQCGNVRDGMVAFGLLTRLHDSRRRLHASRRRLHASRRRRLRDRRRRLRHSSRRIVLYDELT